MDDDTAEFLKQKNKDTKIDDDVMDTVQLLAKTVKPIMGVVKAGYTVDEEVGNVIFTGMIASILLQASPNSDVALNRLIKLSSSVRDEIVKLDTAVIKGVK